MDNLEFLSNVDCMSFLSQLHNGVIVQRTLQTDPYKYQVIYVNNYLVKMLGVSAEEILVEQTTSDSCTGNSWLYSLLENLRSFQNEDTEYKIEALNKYFKIHTLCKKTFKCLLLMKSPTKKMTPLI